MSSFYIDYDESGSAARRFASKAEDLGSAATEGAAGGRVFPDLTSGLAELLLGPLAHGQHVVNLADQILTATSGRLQSYSAELLALSTLVDDTVRVTNEIDVEYSL